MSIGSVPARPEHNCVRNVTFRNIYFDNPIKAIYVKTNPGHGGVESGEITNILYENI
jgi:polygalacturonase